MIKIIFFKKVMAIALLVLFATAAVSPVAGNTDFTVKTLLTDQVGEEDNAEMALKRVLTHPLKNNPIFFDDTGIQWLGDMEHQNDFHRKKVVSKNVMETVNSNGLHFYGESNASIYIVTVESSSNITLVDGMYIITLRSNGTQTATGSDYGCCWVTDGTVLGGLGGSGSSEGVMVGELRFLRLKFGEIINYTYDNRDYQEYEHNQTMFGSTHWLHENYTDFTLPSGKWHFIFTALRFDLEQEDVLPNYKVWLNFSEEYEDLEISTSEGGKIHGLCYAEYDANIIVSKSWASEFMMNGKASFDIENTFIYKFYRHPRANGFWRVKWNTPDGIKKFNMVMRKNNWYYNKDKVEGCVWGIGKSGYYELSTSYLDYDYEKFWTWTPYFVGLDVKLP